MTIALIFILILFGILLLILEILVLPGLVAGIFGVVLMVAGILWTYRSYGSFAGNLTLLGTALLSGISVYYALRSKAWERFGLKGQLEGKTPSNLELPVQEGDELTAVSALRPMGTVLVGDQRVEAQTNGELVPAGSMVVVLKVLSNKLIVKPKN